MAEVIIDIQNLSKMYRLGTIGTGSFRQDLQHWFTTKVLRKHDPFFHTSNSQANTGEAFWALQNVSFDVKQGETLGIIGNNGSGKSTLLKIVSRIVRPTRGTVRGYGKVSSLLEVGTGFNNELTGRENIYLSGYLLGMSRDEIKRKFDEIVDFSSIEKFLDTPVKRYSSGMYVRLAFAVAAHLEPDILIVDEVLAVGDTDFQKKCLGKMREISRTDGRTILFVSHSMQAITNLCETALWLQNGKVQQWGSASEIVTSYVSTSQKHRLKQEWNNPETAPANQWVRFKSVELIPTFENSDDILDVRTPLTVKFQFWSLQDDVQLNIGLMLYSYTGECIFDLISPIIICQKGLVEGECNIPGNFFNDGSYYISINVAKDTSVRIFDLEECLSFDLEDYRGEVQWFGKWKGVVRPQFPFRLEQKELVCEH